MGSLCQALAERNVLARNFAKRYHEIVWRDTGRRDQALVERLQQGEPLFLRTPGDERDLKQDQVVRISQAQKSWCVSEPGSREDMDNLEEIVRRNTERAHQRVLDGLRHLVEPGFVVASFEHVNSGDRHLKSPSFCWLRGRSCNSQFRTQSKSPSSPCQ